MYTVKIGWGMDYRPEDPEAKTVRYDFHTLPEMRAFLKGVDEANGWLECYVHDVKYAGGRQKKQEV